MSDDTSPPPSSLPQPLRRARSGRWLGGVCSGIALRWGIPVAQVRTLFIVATVLAGLGMLAYVACWLVLPADDAGEHPSLARGVASLALLAAACVGLVTLAAAAALATLFGFGWAVAVALGVFLVGALVAWPVVRPAWVLLPLAAVALPAIATAASGVRIAAQAGVVVATPRTVADIPADGYRTGLGDLLVDLRQLDVQPDEQVSLRIDAGIGRTVVALPRNRCFDLDVRYRTARAGVGLVRRVLLRDYGVSGTGAYLYGQPQPPGAGRWLRESDDPHAPTLRVDFTSVDGELWLRDYPVATGPLYEPDWPLTLMSPPSPGARRWAWRDPHGTPPVQRRWRAWRHERRAFDRRLAELRAGACAQKASR
jgi:phage shock protein PspC (stress-responsive transcriptional regulator)